MNGIEISGFFGVLVSSGFPYYLEKVFLFLFYVVYLVAGCVL
jgi:hypothetical protein